MTVRQLRTVHADRWDFLAGVLPHGINPTDIDLSYERNGRFLFLEGKRPGQRISRGQRIYFDRLHDGEKFIVVHFEGNPPDDVQRFGVWGKPLEEATADDLRAFIRRWFAWADQRRQAA